MLTFFIRLHRFFRFKMAGVVLVVARCNSCSSIYDNEVRKKKILPCSHSICMLCLEVCLENKMVKGIWSYMLLLFLLFLCIKQDSLKDSAICCPAFLRHLSLFVFLILRLDCFKSKVYNFLEKNYKSFMAYWKRKKWLLWLECSSRQQQLDIRWKNKTFIEQRPSSAHWINFMQYLKKLEQTNTFILFYSYYFDFLYKQISFTLWFLKMK